MSVAITGMGIVSPLGVGLKETRANLRRGKSGIASISQFASEGFPVRIGGEVRDPSIPPGAGRMTAMAGRALQEALADAGLDCQRGPERRAASWAFGKQAVEVAELAAHMQRTGSSTAAELLADEEFVRRRIENEPATIAHRLSRSCGAEARVYCSYTACASGNDALGVGMQLIERDAADVVVAGASDSQVQPLGLLEFHLLDALANGDPAIACRPFDRRRTGFVVGEGAAVLILESQRHARARSAHIHALLTGYGSSLDSYGLTKCHPLGRGAALAIRRALAAAGADPAEVAYINAHGTGTILNDRSESQAIWQVWGADTRRVPVSSTKSMTGHLIASASAVEAVFAVLSIEGGFIPATLNYENFDPECDLNVMTAMREAPVPLAVSNGFGFGGQNSAIVLRHA